MSALEALKISSPGARTQAEFVPAANMLGSSLRHDGAELLDLGRGLDAYAARGKTMGIPLLYPWANRLAAFDYQLAGKSVRLPSDPGRIPVDPGGLPIHGLVPGLLEWDVLEVSSSSVSARLSWDSERLLELFPFEHQVAVRASVDDGELKIATAVRASGADAVPVSFGYHPYVRVPDAGRESWQIELGARQRLVVDEHMIPTGERQPLEQRSFRLSESSWDDGLADLDTPPVFSVAGGGLELRVRFLEGYSFAQVYAPPGKDFICFEPMTAPTNALRSGEGLTLVQPGGEHSAAFAISVSDAPV